MKDMAMDLTPAPFFTDVSPGPSDGAAWWLTAQDGVQVRVGIWNRGAPNGTVLLFPGRTEYIEKYGISAQELADRGYATVSIDWRGQGLAGRFLDDARVGHVLDFTDYQYDVAAMVRCAQAQGLPKPYFLLAHSMGGCIGLRALTDGLDVGAAAFTGPMWGIRIDAHMVVPAHVLAHVMPRIGRGGDLPPGTKIDPYVLTDPFEDNMLTRDKAMHDMMRDQLAAHPELSLGGPSFTWLREALKETKALALRPSPNLPCVTYLGDNERIVHVRRIHDRMAKWPTGRIEMIENGEHEVQMEGPDLRKHIFDDMAEEFARAV